MDASVYDESIDRAAHLRYFEDAVRLLAQSCDLQLQIFNEGRTSGIEMIDDFYAWYLSCIERGYLQGLAASQTEALENIDALLKRMLALNDDDLWYDIESVHSSPWWQELRLTALAALKSLDWPPDAPLLASEMKIIHIHSADPKL